MGVPPSACRGIGKNWSAVAKSCSSWVTPPKEIIATSTRMLAVSSFSRASFRRMIPWLRLSIFGPCME